MVIDAEIDLLLNVIEDNSLIGIVDSDLFIDNEIKELFHHVCNLYKIDNIVTKSTFSQFLSSKSLHKYKSFLDLKINRNFEECVIILSKEYNKSLYTSLLNNRELYLSEDKMINELNRILSNYKKPTYFNLCKSIDETINYLKNKGENKFPIGISTLDNLLEITYDRFITIGGSSGSGKTAFSIFLIDRLCSMYADKLEIMFISLEMSEKRILSRLLSLHLGKPIKSISNNIDLYMDKILDFRSKVKDYPLEIIYTDLDVQKLNSILQGFSNRVKHKGKIPVLFLDHFGEVAGLDELSAKSNVDKITSAIKSFCKRGGCAFGLTQLRKDLKDKKNKPTWYKPSNAYIMNSQSVEARSDAIIHLWRPEHDNFNEIVYEQENIIYEINTRNSICLVLDKNRDDEKSEIWLDCNIGINHFQEIDNRKIRKIEK